MSPIEKIKHAFLSQDWTIVQEAYKDLTGQELVVKETVKKTIGKKSKKIETPLKVDEPTPLPKVSSIVEEQETFTTIKRAGAVQAPQKFVGADGKEHTYCGVEQIDLSKSKINLFDDDLSLETNFIGKPNKPLKKVKETTRQGYNDSLVEAQCKGCDRFFKVPRDFASHYRCDGCMVRR